MAKLPALTPQELLTALKRAGFHIDRQKGSHITLKHERNKKLHVTIPYHKNILKKGTLHNIIKQAGFDRDKFLKLLKK